MAQATTTSTRSRGPVTGTARQAPAKRRPILLDLWQTGVGKKYVMALTGIMLMGFVFFHMLGNLKMYLGPAEFDHYADWLRQLLVPFLPRTVFLWLMRVGLITAFALHILAAYSLTRQNQRSRPVGYQSKRDYLAANYASRTMRWSGIIVGLFVVFHLFDLSWTGTGFSYHRGDPYANVAHSLHRPVVAAFYIVANLALGLHLFHGSWSLFQSLGWNNPRFNRWRRAFATGFAGLIAVVNVSFPIMVLAGVVGHVG